jgi:hypothetical protein
MNVDMVPNAKWLHHFGFNNHVKKKKKVVLKDKNLAKQK